MVNSPTHSDGPVEGTTASHVASDDNISRTLVELEAQNANLQRMLTEAQATVLELGETVKLAQGLDHSTMKRIDGL